MICLGSGIKEIVSDFSILNRKARCPICGNKIKITIPDAYMHGNTAKFARHSDKLKIDL